MMGAMYVQVVVDSLNEMFPNLLVFISSKLLNLKYYPSDEELCITMLEPWLKRLIIKFESMVVESDAKLLEYVLRWDNQCILQMTCRIIQGALTSFEIKIMKEFQIMKGPLKEDNPITSKVDRYNMWGMDFLVEIIQGLNFRILGILTPNHIF